YCLAHVGESAAHGFIRTVGLAGELQCQTPRLTDADQSILATGLAQALDQPGRVATIEKLVFQGEGVFHPLILPAARGCMPFSVPGAVVHDTAQGPRVVARVFRRAPYAGDAELATAAFRIVERAIDPPPGMMAAHLDAPSMAFCIPEGCLDLFLRVCGTGHQQAPVWRHPHWLSTDNLNAVQPVPPAYRRAIIPAAPNPYAPALFPFSPRPSPLRGRHW